MCTEGVGTDEDMRQAPHVSVDAAQTPWEPFVVFSVCVWGGGGGGPRVRQCPVQAAPQPSAATDAGQPESRGWAGATCGHCPPPDAPLIHKGAHAAWPVDFVWEGSVGLTKGPNRSGTTCLRSIALLTQIQRTCDTGPVRVRAGVRARAGVLWRDQCVVRLLSYGYPHRSTLRFFTISRGPAQAGGLRRH